MCSKSGRKWKSCWDHLPASHHRSPNDKDGREEFRHVPKALWQKFLPKGCSGDDDVA